LKKIFETNGSAQYARSEVRNVLLLSQQKVPPRFYDEKSLAVIRPGHTQYSRRYDTFKKGFQSAFEEIAEKRASYAKQNAPFLGGLTVRSLFASPTRALNSLAVRWKMSRLNRQYDRLNQAYNYLDKNTPKTK